MKKITSALVIVALLTIFTASTVLAGIWQGYIISATIYGGQDTKIGYTKIWNDEDSLNVQFMMRGGAGWCLSEYHIHVGETLYDFPYNPGGNLQVGQFDYTAELGGCATNVVVEIPLADLEAKGILPLDEFFMAIHIVANNWITGEEETGWAVRCGDLEGQQFPGDNWAGFIRFTPDAWYLFD